MRLIVLLETLKAYHSIVGDDAEVVPWHTGPLDISCVTFTADRREVHIMLEDQNDRENQRHR